MIEFLKKILGGFGLGLGFAVAAVGVLYISSDLMMDKMVEDAATGTEERMSESFGYKKFDEDSGLGIKSHKERKIENGVEFLAEIENVGETTWSSVSIEVELFDDQNQFIDECSDYIRGNLAPQQIKNTKIKCGGCENNPLPVYSSYTIKVVDASSF